jgi:hypothetical protein
MCYRDDDSAANHSALRNTGSVAQGIKTVESDLSSPFYGTRISAEVKLRHFPKPRLEDVNRLRVFWDSMQGGTSHVLVAKLLEQRARVNRSRNDLGVLDRDPLAAVLGQASSEFV